MIISDYERLEIIISDNRDGIQDLDLESSRGMGPHNLKDRALEIWANLLFKHEKGHTINLACP
jgi:signal transduction histidine kinase